MIDTWLAYSEFLLKHCADAMAASQVCWRANKQVADKDTFMAKYESLKLAV